MTLRSSTIRTEIEELCVELGSDSLLVQGAGGNVSWKENETLWVKGSGTSLSDASVDDIFVPIDLPDILKAVSAGRFDVIPIVKSDTKLRPSIETLLHALIPKRVVLHLHAVDVLCRLVRDDSDNMLQNALPNNFKFLTIDYCNPGADLAKAVYQEIQKKDGVGVIFLLNHGLVVAGGSVSEVSTVLNFILNRLEAEIHINNDTPLSTLDKKTINKFAEYGYIPAELSKYHELATNPNLQFIVEHKWAMYPDHVVFLGPKAVIGDCDFVDKCLMTDKSLRPAFVFCKDVGTFQHVSVSRSQLDLLNCFYNVAVRQNDVSKIVALPECSIHALLAWDAEKYRLQMSKR